MFPTPRCDVCPRHMLPQVLVHLKLHTLCISQHWKHSMGQQRSCWYLQTLRPRMLTSGCHRPLISATLSFKAPSSRSLWYWMFKQPCPYPWPRTWCPGFGANFLASKLLNEALWVHVSCWDCPCTSVRKCGEWENIQLLVVFEEQVEGISSQPT